MSVLQICSSFSLILSNNIVGKNQPRVTSEKILKSKVNFFGCTKLKVSSPTYLHLKKFINDFESILLYNHIVCISKLQSLFVMQVFGLQTLLVWNPNPMILCINTKDYHSPVTHRLRIIVLEYKLHEILRYNSTS